MRKSSLVFVSISSFGQNGASAGVAVDVETASGTLHVVRQPLILDGKIEGILQGVPELGEHDAEILNALPRAI